MATATARLTVGSLFGTVTTAASAITSTLDTAVRGISMLDAYVKDAQERQELRSLVDMDTFTAVLQEEKAMEEAQRKAQVLEFTSKNAQNLKLYSDAYDRIGKLIADRKSA